MLLRVLTGLAVVACSVSARADLIELDYITNGNFGAVVPSLAGWTTESNTAANWFADSDPGFSLGAGPYARTDNASSSSFQRLFQEFLLPTVAQESATLSWRDRFDSAVDWVNNSQEYRVVLQRVVGGTLVGTPLEAFSTALNPTVQSAGPTDRSKSDSQLINFVNDNLGQTIRLSFEVVDSGVIPDVAVDTVRFFTVFDTESIPEPSSLLLALVPGLGLLVRRRRRQAAARS
jgi:hypothetical protein